MVEHLQSRCPQAVYKRGDCIAGCWPNDCPQLAQHALLLFHWLYFIAIRLFWEKYGTELAQASDYGAEATRVKAFTQSGIAMESHGLTVCATQVWRGPNIAAYMPVIRLDMADR